jgi:hypothetical protein
MTSFSDSGKKGKEMEGVFVISVKNKVKDFGVSCL